MDYKALAANVENREGFGTQEWVYRVLRAGIVNGTLPGGMQLKQDEISSALNVSHIPVREALRQLEAQQLVTIHANRGATVTELSRDMLINTMQVRAAISVAMLAVAVPRMTEEDFRALDAILEELRSTTDLIATE
ncbi:MAG: GntR family transcriptional regulator, partial [Clostridia bacterium]|nr:GntR family transcriptional regulator [Clostridia bacterium]